MIENRTLLTDPDMKNIAENEIKECHYEIEELQASPYNNMIYSKNRRKF